jgi:hypothetical protein
MEKDCSYIKLELGPWLNSEFVQNVSDLRNQKEKKLYELYIYVLF